MIQSGNMHWIRQPSARSRLCLLGYPDRLHSLTNLAVAKHACFEFSGRQEDVDGSIISLREAIEVLPSGVSLRAVAFSRLADALLFHFMSCKAPDNLEESAARGKEALSACGP